jgi:hypothetical protein
VCETVLETATVTTTVKHALGDWEEVTAPTCTEDGERKKSCTNEGCTYFVTDVIDAIGHDLKDVAGKEANCTEAGYTAYKACSRCDYVEGKTVIDAKGHDMGDWVNVDSTHQKRECQRAGCDYSQTQTVGCMHLEMSEWAETKAATCTESGEQERHCLTEGCEWSETKTINTIPHDLKDVSAKAATCTEDGYTAHKKCSRCDYTEGFEVSPKLGHKKGEGVVTKAPNCTEGGTKIYYCENPGCGEEIDIEALPPAGHNMQPASGKDSTCTEHGYTAHTACTKCGHTEGKIELELADHEMGEWVKIDDDTIRRDCENCDHYETKPAPMDGENIDKDGWTKPTT